MAPPIESQYKDLLCPVKDPEKSFGINIAELLQDYLSNLVQGRVPPNFNSAALLLQGSSSIYGKKVEYLHNLATQLHQNLIKQKKAEQGKKENGKEKEKTKTPKTNEILSLDIKRGKNLSCLSKKNSSKNSSSKKPPKKIRNIFMPVHLMSLDDDEKGDVLYDVRGEVIGNKGDYALIKCKLTSSGWLLLPTISASLISTSPQAYYEESMLDATAVGNELPNTCSPDEGLGSEPKSSECNSQPMSSPMDGVETQLNSHPNSSDMGIDVNCSMDAIDTYEQSPSEGIENVPTTQMKESAVMPVRHSVRQALKELTTEENEDVILPKELKRILEARPLKKGNTVSLPKSLRNSRRDDEPADDIAVFCSRTFFVPELKLTKKERFLLDGVESFRKNIKFYKILTERLRQLRASVRQRNDAFEEDDEINVDDVESERGHNIDDENHAFTPLEDCDIPIDNNEEHIDRGSLPETPIASCESPIFDYAVENPETLANKHIEECMKELQNVVPTSDTSEKVHEWETAIRPVLDEIEQRESFDINLYGSRILNAFEDSDRKQTMTFKEFCKGKQKWEIHRYFMALLPLANIGNVQIESEPTEDGTDEQILVTLLSRKMHHKELEEFGHQTGEHT